MSRVAEGESEEGARLGSKFGWGGIGVKVRMDLLTFVL